MSKLIAVEEFSESVHISECSDGFWLYDKTRGMNLAMRAKTREDALKKAVSYYQHRLAEAEAENKAFRDKVEAFVTLFPEFHSCDCDQY